MKLSISLAAVLAMVAVLAFGAATSSSAIGDENAVVHWSGIAEAAISATPPDAAAGLRPPASSTVLAAMVHGAMYDAVAATKGRLQPFVADVDAAPGASVGAAVATAARDVLIGVGYPSRITDAQKAVVEAKYDEYLGLIGEADSGPGAQVGAAAAHAMLELRKDDGFTATVLFTPRNPLAPGDFESIAPPPPAAAGQPVDAKLAAVTPFTYDTPSDYRPKEPYALTSKKYADDLAELKLLGGATGSARTAEQTATVNFFTAPTFVQYSGGLRGVVNNEDLGIRESARLLGYAWVALADTMIACWEAKYYYQLWRPVNAIREQHRDGSPADDGNRRTVPDPTWSHLVAGNHPEYPSGHACFTAGLTTALHQYFGTKKVEITLTRTVAGVTETRTYSRLDDLVDQVGDARVWGGLHYRNTMDVTAKHFPKIARDVAGTFLSEGH